MATLNGYVEASEIIGDVAQAIHDPSMVLVKPPTYMRLFQKALGELAQDVPFDQRHIQIQIPANKKVPLPKYISGIRNIYLYNGDGCDINGSVTVLIKENYAHNGSTGSFSNVKWCNFGGFTQDQLGWLLPYRIFVAGISEGCIDLSPASASWDNIRIEYTGLGFDEYSQDEKLYAPMWARQALVDRVAAWALEIRMNTEGKERFYLELYKMRKEEHDSSSGSWMTARMRWAMLDQKQMQDLVVEMTGTGGGY